jgi:ribosomal-protein-alanine N-acetyltransferase
LYDHFFAAMISVSLAHAPLMAAIHAAAFASSEAWSSEAIEAQLRLPGTFGFLAKEGGMILARVIAEEAEILTLAVAPKARGKKLGRALLCAAMAEAARRGAKSMALEVAKTNEKANALYRAVGFVPVGQRLRYYADGSDAWVMRVALTPAPVCATKAE